MRALRTQVSLSRSALAQIRETELNGDVEANPGRNPKSDESSIDDSISSPGDIKKAYAKWLQDLELDPKCKLKKMRKRKIKRMAALKHLLQPTESSTQKHASADLPGQRSRTSLPSASTVESTVVSYDEAQRRRFQILADEANFAHFTYENSLVPGLSFFALLARQAQALTQQESGKTSLGCQRAELRNFPVQVPPTVVREYGRFHHGECSVLLFFTVEQSHNVPHGKSGLPTSRNGAKSTIEPLYVLQFHFFTTQDMYLSRLPWIQRIVTSTTVHGPILGLLKTTQSGTLRGPFDLQALTNSQEMDSALRSLWNDQHEEAHSIGFRAVQKYIECKGCSSSSGKTNAWIARAVYRKRDQSASSVWILTGNNPNWASTSWPADGCTDTAPCQIVKCTNAQSWITPRVIAESLVQYLDVTLRSSFAELVLDLVQDHEGQWCLLQIKAFQLRRMPLPLNPRVKSAPDRLETASMITTSSSSSKMSKWKCMGRYCSDDTDLDNNSFVPHDSLMDENPAGFLTKKELLTCEFYARSQSMDDMSMWSGTVGGFAAAVAFYLQHELRPRDRAILYHAQPLCSVCLQRYYQLRVRYTGEMASQDEDDGNIRHSAMTNPTKTRVPKSKSLKALSIVPRTLPTLDHTSAAKPFSTMKPSLSMPVLDSTLHVTAHDCVVPPQRTQVTPAHSYLDDFDSIERMLAQEESQDTREVSKHDPFASLSWLSTDLERNIDAMWESVHLKPVSLSQPSNTWSVRAQPQYNSFSLDQVLCDNSSSNSVCSEQVTPHIISIVNSHKVVVDDTFRQSLVQDAIRQLLENDRSRSVQFVVLPPDTSSDLGTDTDTHADTTMVLTSHEALGRVALSALFVELATVLQQAASSKCMPSSPPIIYDHVSGCLNMVIAS